MAEHRTGIADTTAPATLLDEKVASRRAFLKKGALAALATTALAACERAGASAPAHEAAEHAAKGAAAAAPAAAAPLSPEPALAAARRSADEMDRMHEAGIKAFPAKTAGKGNVIMQPRIEKGVKVYDLTAAKIQWETAPGQKTEAWSYNGIVPGPQIRVREGDRVRVNLVNNLPESTAIHFHGLELPNNMDGVPFITQPPVKPGEKYTYEFTVPMGNHGSHMYHSHHNSPRPSRSSRSSGRRCASAS